MFSSRYRRVGHAGPAADTFGAKLSANQALCTPGSGNCQHQAKKRKYCASSRLWFQCTDLNVQKLPLKPFNVPVDFFHRPAVGTEPARSPSPREKTPFPGGCNSAFAPLLTLHPAGMFRTILQESSAATQSGRGRQYLDNLCQRGTPLAEEVLRQQLCRIFLPGACCKGMAFF